MVTYSEALVDRVSLFVPTAQRSKLFEHALKFSCMNRNYLYISASYFEICFMRHVELAIVQKIFGIHILICPAAPRCLPRQHQRLSSNSSGSWHSPICYEGTESQWLLHAPYLALKFLHLILPDNQFGRPWWDVLALDTKEMEIFTDTMIDTYENPSMKGQASPEIYAKDSEGLSFKAATGLTPRALKAMPYLKTLRAVKLRQIHKRKITYCPKMA